VGRLSIAALISNVRTAEEVYDLLDPDVMWYSVDVDSNYTCNDREDVIACIERAIGGGIDGRFDVLREQGDDVIVRPVLEPPREASFCQLLRFRDGLIVEMRDFASLEAADRYAGMTEVGAIDL
jgi:hypothetical protein